jgi:hypothetical protein
MWFLPGDVSLLRIMMEWLKGYRHAALVLCT